MRRDVLDLRLLCALASLLLFVPGCSRGAREPDACPGRTLEDSWIREYADQPNFALSLCIPPGYRQDGPLTWRRPSEGGAIRVNAGFSGPEDLDWPCGLDCPPITRQTTHLRWVQDRAAVLETGLTAGGRSASPAGNVALLRIEVAPALWLVIRAIHRDPEGLKELTRALETVRIERVGYSPGRSDRQ